MFGKTKENNRDTVRGNTEQTMFTGNLEASFFLLASNNPLWTKQDKLLKHYYHLHILECGYRLAHAQPLLDGQDQPGYQSP